MKTTKIIMMIAAVVLTTILLPASALADRHHGHRSFRPRPCAPVVVYHRPVVRHPVYVGQPVYYVAPAPVVVHRPVIVAPQPVCSGFSFNLRIR